MTLLDIPGSSWHDEMTVQCDFCVSSKPVWSYSTNSQPEQWLACKTCYRLIERDDWNRLLHRYLGFSQEMSIQTHPDACISLLNVWAHFALTRVGSAERIA